MNKHPLPLHKHSPPNKCPSFKPKFWKYSSYYRFLSNNREIVKWWINDKLLILNEWFHSNFVSLRCLEPWSHSFYVSVWSCSLLWGKWQRNTHQHHGCSVQCIWTCISALSKVNVNPIVNDGNWTEWSPIWSVIIWVINNWFHDITEDLDIVNFNYCNVSERPS